MSVYSPVAEGLASSSSSRGPSSPVTHSGPVDLLTTLSMYIGDSVSDDGECGASEDTSKSGQLSILVDKLKCTEN